MKNRERILAKLEKAKPILFSKYPLKTMAIFGSVSRDEDSAGSDVDILVEFSAPIGLGYIHLALQLETLLDRKVDLVSLSGIKSKYFQAIESDLIYV